MGAREFSLLVLFLAACGIGAARGETVKTITLPPETATFDSGENDILVQGFCLTCHSADYPTTQPLPTLSGWQAVVDKMRNTFGAPVPSAFDAPIVDFLVTHYGCQPVSVTGFWPGRAGANQLVLVFGQHFKILHGSAPTVRFNGLPSTVFQLLSDDLLFAMPPPGDTTGPITVETDCGIAASPTNFGTAATALAINGLWPGQARVNDVVLVFGSGFNPLSGASQVDVNGTPASFVQTVDQTLLFTVVPAGAVTGPVHVTVGGVTVSSPVNLVVLP